MGSGILIVLVGFECAKIHLWFTPRAVGGFNSTKCVCHDTILEYKGSDALFISAFIPRLIPTGQVS